MLSYKCGNLIEWDQHCKDNLDELCEDNETTQQLWLSLFAVGWRRIEKLCTTQTQHLNNFILFTYLLNVTEYKPKTLQCKIIVTMKIAFWPELHSRSLNLDEIFKYSII